MRLKHGLVTLALALASLATARGEDKPAPQKPTGATVGPDAVQDLIFLGDKRPIFLRLRMGVGETPFRAAWKESVKAMHAFLDRDGDGKVTSDEADRGSLATLVRVANGGATAMPRADLDARPKDGVVSIDELSDALRTALGPFRVQAGKVASKKTDAVFERLDADGDGKLTKAELTDAAASLHKLDLDDDELIDGAELEPFANPTALQMAEMPGRRGAFTEGPPVVELTPDDSSLRPVRQLLKKYDRGTSRAGSSGDNKLSREEFAIDPGTFAGADADADGGLDTEELRRFLAKAPPDIELTVAIPADAGGSAKITASGPDAKSLPTWAKATQVGPGDVEIAADEIRLDIHVDDGAEAVAGARRTYMAMFEAADADNNGYVEKSEATKDKDHPSPLAGLFDLLDRDGDGKLYPKEVEAFVDGQAKAARERMVLTASDQGRAIFSILDANRDQRLGHREIRATPDRVSAWDRNSDGRIDADEIPHHYQLTLGRGRLGSPTNAAAAVTFSMNPEPPTPTALGPSWFRRMDRNRDGDVSRREFYGPKAQFGRLDMDKDGLLDATEAAGTTASASASKPREK